MQTIKKVGKDAVKGKRTKLQACAKQAKAKEDSELELPVVFEAEPAADPESCALILKQFCWIKTLRSS